MGEVTTLFQPCFFYQPNLSLTSPKRQFYYINFFLGKRKESLDLSLGFILENSLGGLVRQNWSPPGLT